MNWVGFIMGLALVGAGAWWWPLRGMVERLEAARAELRRQEARLVEVRRAAAEAERIEAELGRLEEELRRLRRRLPEEAEIREVFDRLSRACGEAGLDLRSWEYRPPQAGTGEARLVAHRAELELRGTYHAFGRLAEAVQGMERIVVLSAWRMRRLEEGRPPQLEVRLQAETYTLRTPKEAAPATSSASSGGARPAASKAGSEEF
jgi:Tfp pilus assembly protein PilO